MTLSENISITAELCDDHHRSKGEGYYSPEALIGFVAAIKDLSAEYPAVVKEVLLDMRTSFKGKLTPMDVRVRVTERISAEANQRSIDAMKAAQKIGNPSGRTYKNRSGIDRPVEELPEMLDRKSTRLNSSHSQQSRMPSSA